MTPRWASLVGGQAMRAVGWARRMPRAVRRVVRPPLTVAIVGCGAIAPTHVAAYHDSGLARVVGVSDVRVPPLADALAPLLSGPIEMHLEEHLDPATLVALADLNPNWAGPRPRESTLLRQSEARRTHALRSLGVALGGIGPILLAIDDLHWASRETVGVLGHIARSSLAAPLLLVATTREPSPATADARARYSRYRSLSSMAVTVWSSGRSRRSAFMSASTSLPDRRGVTITAPGTASPRN